MKDIFFSIFFVTLGFILSTYINKNQMNNIKNESQCNLKKNEKCIFLIQNKVKSILDENNVNAQLVKINLRSVFLNSFIKNKSVNFSIKSTPSLNINNTNTNAEVEILENIENDMVVNFIFQISIFTGSNKINEIVENVDIDFLN